MDNSNSLYLELLKTVLTDSHRSEIGEYQPISGANMETKSSTLLFLNKYVKSKGYVICKKVPFYPENRVNGWDWPPPLYADTMIGLKRLNNLQFCVSDIIKNNVEGDLIETGVWRGGATIFMKAVLKANNVNDRIIWVADSFEGLPKPDAEKYPEDKGDNNYIFDELAVSMETVKHNFDKYGLLDENVKFLKGWFKDTLPVAPMKKLAIMRLDGDMYESTMDGLVNLYPKLSKGGYIIVDDYNNKVLGCKQAVTDYRLKYNITEEIKEIDWTGVYWKKEN